MKNIYLIGFMGSGKSTIGERLSNTLNYPHIDTDKSVEEIHGIKIAEIFKQCGVKTFREFETDVLHNIPIDNYIVSTGGGIVEKKENIEYMQYNGLIIFLQASFENILNRLKDDHSRPLWDNDYQTKKKLFKRREEMYRKCADLMIQTDDKTLDSIVHHVNDLIKRKK